MTRKNLVLVTMAALLGTGVWSFGCGSSGSGGGPNAGSLDGGRRDGGGITGDGGPGADDAGGTGTGTANDQQCAANGADADSCSQCCIDNHSSGQRTFIVAVHTCECGNNGPCRSPCASTFCSSQVKAPDPSCVQCMEKDLLPDAGTSCFGLVDQACAGDPDCVAQQKCFGICPK